MIRYACVIALTLLTATAEARMYQWVNPATGRTQLSGRPPHWYRSEEAGPRVFVIENGRVIDDTSVTVSDERRQALRQEAFHDVAAAEPAGAPRTAADADAAAAAPDDNPATTPDKSFDGAAPGEKTVAGRTETPEETIARLKTLIDIWEEQKTEEARRLLQRTATAAPPAGTFTPATPPQ